MTGECDPVHMLKCLRCFRQHGCPVSDGGIAACGDDLRVA
jgi:hypothetical protein